MAHRADEGQNEVRSMLDPGNRERSIELRLHIPQELHERFLRLHDQRFYRDKTVNDLFMVVLNNGIKKLEDRRKKKEKERAKSPLPRREED